MTIGAVVTEFQRSLDDIRQKGMEAGQNEGPAPTGCPQLR